MSTIPPTGSASGALLELNLDGKEIEALSRQGYLERVTRRGGRADYWRLRFRVCGRLQTRYVGNDNNRVEMIRRQLAILQSARRADRQLAKTVRHGKKVMRQAKARLKPTLVKLGFYFHGDALRKIRAGTAPPN